MTTLTRLALNPARREARALLGSPQAMHGAVLAGFPVPPQPEEGRILWRVDRDDRQTALLYLLSPKVPDLTHIVEQAGWPTTTPWESRSYLPLLNRLATGQRWAFRLTANPVRQLSRAERQRSEVKAHVTADQQREWFLSRTDAWGFTVPTAAGTDDRAVVVSDRRSLSFARQGRTINLVTASFNGMLDVTDAELLRQALLGGCGRAKAYGCGLLTLALSGDTMVGRVGLEPTTDGL